MLIVTAKCKKCGIEFEHQRRRGPKPTLCHNCCSTTPSRPPNRECVCEHCGKSWTGRKRRFCSSRCNQLWRYGRQKQVALCQECGASFTAARPSSRHCSAKCAQAKRRKPLLKCEECGIEFRKGQSSRNAGRFCSRECAFKSKKRVQCKCELCGAGFSGYSLWTKRCVECKEKAAPGEFAKAISAGVIRWVKSFCPQCGVSKSYLRELCEECDWQRYLATRRSQYVQIRRYAGCCLCGVTLTNHGQSKYCDVCKDKAAREHRNSTRSHRKRARKYGGKYIPFRRSYVFKRDGYVCQICNRKCRTDVSYLHERYPTLDHIVPMSKGGDHTPENTQCACRGCNTKKSTKVGYQRRLIG